MSVAEIVENRHPPSRLVITCEHASNHVPDGFDLSESDRAWLETHWGWDLGAQTFVRRLAELEDAPAILSRFSRLICDPNRSFEQDNLIRTEILGEPVDFNTDLDDEEIERRLAEFHDGFHRVAERRIARAAERNPDIFLLSVHTFTPELDGEVRDVELGLLFDDYPSHIDRIADAMRVEGFETALNEPYSGWNDMIYSVERHAKEHDLRYLELEIRNDLLETQNAVSSMAERIHRALDDTVLRPAK